MMKGFVFFIFLSSSLPATTVFAHRPVPYSQDSRALTPLQREIEKQRSLLASSDTETRREALIRLGNLRHPESSRVAATGLNDAIPLVRATAAHAVLSLPANESVAALTPLLNDKQEFVRQQAAYALGETKSALAVTALVNSLAGDKENSVRGAAAVALGEIGDQTAVLPLAAVLDPASAVLTPGQKKKSSRKQENEFVTRAAARALGLIGSHLGVPPLVKVLTGENSPADLRREAAAALGLIGDAAANPALRSVLGSDDPHLSRLAYEALRRIERHTNRQGM